jgi:endonuclease/exonuclease/phosphatase family metal-dependent hydrolase
VSWNTHVGAADLIAFIAAIRAGRFTDDQPPIAFVLLLQEAVRPAAAARARQDVALVARDTGLDAFYVPSMPNGRRPDGTVSDRGNAILSTLPLSGLTAIELPFDRQRRVAAAADLDVPVGGGLVHLRVVSAHLDATASAARLRVFASGLRERQSRALVSALAADQTVIVGVDLNTWSEAVGEPAYRLLQQAFPGTPRPPLRATFRTGFLLDYLFFRLPPGVQGTSALGPDRFGSDHHPLIGRLRVG